MILAAFFWFSADRQLKIIPSRWAGPSAQEVHKAESELKKLNDQIKDLHFKINSIEAKPKKQSTEGSPGQSSDPTINDRHKLEELEYKKDSLAETIKKFDPMLSHAKAEDDSLVHSKITTDDGETADNYIHGTFENRTGTLAWCQGKKQVINQEDLPEELLSKLQETFNPINEIKRF